MKEWLKHVIKLFENHVIESHVHIDRDGKRYVFVDCKDLRERFE